MRYVSLILVLVSSAAVAGDRMPKEADAYYACLVGRGAVELQYEKNVQKALDVAVDACTKQQQNAAASSDEGSDFIVGNAQETLMRITGEAK